MRPLPPHPPLPRLHAISDERIARRADLDDIARELAVGGGPHLALHARGPGLSGLEHYELAVRLRAAAGPLGSTGSPVRLFVNDRLDVALATGAQGVQLRMESLSPADARRLNPEWWIGLSVHDLEQARAAQAAGADYLIVGPVFATATHSDRTPLGVQRLAEIVQLGLPVIAIGGVTPDRVPELRRAAAYGVAAIRALWDATDPADAVHRMMQELESA